MRIAIVSDAWTPQVNGVVRTLTATIAALRRRDHMVETITPEDFTSLPCPSYPEIRLALAPKTHMRRRLDRFGADAIHIATEGPLGWAARRWCLSRSRPFTTSFHTRFPDYLSLRTHLSADLFWPALIRFHRPAERVFVATASLEAELLARGLRQIHRWERGVDLDLFHPEGDRLAELATVRGPILLYVGRIAQEKNIAAFLAAKVMGTKVLVGDGPAADMLRARYPDAMFLGALKGERLASAYRSAAVLVFPSLTDTFGLVMAEAIATGVPVAAFPVAGPVDVLRPDTGCMDADLAHAIESALALPRPLGGSNRQCFDWERCTDQFIAGLTLTHVGTCAA